MCNSHEMTGCLFTAKHSCLGMEEIKRHQEPYIPRDLTLAYLRLDDYSASAVLEACLINSLRPFLVISCD